MILWCVVWWHSLVWWYFTHKELQLNLIGFQIMKHPKMWHSKLLTCPTAKCLPFSKFMIHKKNLADWHLWNVVQWDTVCSRYIPQSFSSAQLMKEYPYLALTCKLWGVIRECKSDQSFIIVITVLCALLYHIIYNHNISRVYSMGCPALHFVLICVWMLCPYHICPWKSPHNLQRILALVTWELCWYYPE